MSGLSQLLERSSMAERASGTKYVPGILCSAQRCPEMANRYIREWQKSIGYKGKGIPTVEYLHLCIPQTGSGAVEIADLVLRKSGTVLLTSNPAAHTTNASLSEKTVAMFDERYPGK